MCQKVFLFQNISQILLAEHMWSDLQSAKQLQMITIFNSVYSTKSGERDIFHSGFPYRESDTTMYKKQEVVLSTWCAMVSFYKWICHSLYNSALQIRRTRLIKVTKQTQSWWLLKLRFEFWSVLFWYHRKNFSGN